jgi:predicted nicotinamide N-methyase
MGGVIASLGLLLGHQRVADRRVIGLGAAAGLAFCVHQAAQAFLNMRSAKSAISQSPTFNRPDRTFFTHNVNLSIHF